MNTPPIVIGQTFDRLTVICEVSATGRHGKAYRCRCECGNESVVMCDKLKSGKTKSCGCLRRQLTTKHGCARDSGVTLTYTSWSSMKSRCTNERNHRFSKYGARGILMCERWNSFENFLADMGERPSASHTIDRIDNNGNYSPENCRWATKKQQSNNTRANINISISGKTQTLKQWCEELGLKYNTILCRLRRGWSAEKSLREPIGEWHGH